MTFESKTQAKEALVKKISDDWGKKKSKDIHEQHSLSRMLAQGLRLCNFEELLNMLKPKERKNFNVVPPEIHYLHK